MRSMVEGHRPLSTTSPHTLPAHFDDPRHRRLNIAQHSRGGHPQRRDALRTQVLRPRRVGFGRTDAIVGKAVHLDIEFCRGAVKIENVNSRRVLATEFEPARSLAEFAPQHNFRKRHFAAELAGAFYRFGRSGYHCLCPSPILRMVPLPCREDFRLCPSTTFGGPPPRSGEDISQFELPETSSGRR